MKSKLAKKMIAAFLAAIMTAIDMRIVFLSLVLTERLAIRTEKAAKIIRRIIFLAISDKVVSGFRIKVIPSTIRKIATIKRFRMMISTLFEIFSTFFTVLSKSIFLAFFFCFTTVYFTTFYGFNQNKIPIEVFF